MAKMCEICGKSTVAGRSIQHRHGGKWRYRAPRTTRTFKPNLKKLWVTDGEKAAKITVCMKCYKRMRKDEEVVEAQAEGAVKASE